MYQITKTKIKMYKTILTPKSNTITKTQQNSLNF